MTGYLVYLIVLQGNTGNCGCFGDTLHMRPLEAIGKNIAMAAITVLLMFIYDIKPYKGQGIFLVIVATASLVMPFVSQPLTNRSAPIDLNPLYTEKGEQHPAIELRKGKHILAFMSLTCPHCRKAAKELVAIRKQYPDLPIFMILNGIPPDEPEFFNDTKSQNIPHILFNSVDDFVKMAGRFVPSIIWVNNGVRVRKVSYMTLSGAEMQRWAEMK
jgi:thiol-disulfide isomerase/thioredoxin